MIDNIRRIKGKMAERRRARKNERAIRHLSARMLRDIGLDRYDEEIFARRY